MEEGKVRATKNIEDLLGDANYDGMMVVSFELPLGLDPGSDSFIYDNTFKYRAMKPGTFALRTKIVRVEETFHIKGIICYRHRSIQLKRVLEALDRHLRKVFGYQTAPMRSMSRVHIIVLSKSQPDRVITETTKEVKKLLDDFNSSE